ncbi:MAG: T9SS type A sorting domain-containing protein, partial [Microscillaceae bacterium]|nr:T9SS type A sorting domain-containing protein [Microscillaceae bacterium]MDW8461940.1 T9SS type A sorting domain-containing protein [Cytophagales bacterium]
RTYEWKVINPTAGYYRLKQIDFNQTLSYSGVVFVKGFDNSHAITLMPNPSNEYLNLTLPLAGNETAWLTICDLHGKVIWQGSTQGDLQWNVSNWANGVYLLQVRTSQGVQYRKFVVNK